MAAAAIRHRTVEANGIAIHVAEAGGEGSPAVLFLHGFPELWYSWRHQMEHLAARGFRCLAPDLRGYGDTAAPPAIESYTAFHIVGDLVALLDALGLAKVFVVGHDWGAIIAWYLCLFRPERVTALVNTSVAFMRPVFIRSGAAAEPGVAEKDLAPANARHVLRRVLCDRLSTDGKSKQESSDDSSSAPPPLPDWLTEADIDYFAAAFERTGFTGGINFYRNMDRNWELTAPWADAKVVVPTKFIVGDGDLTYHYAGIQDYIHKGGFKADVPLLEDVVVIPGAGHFIQQEKAQEVSDLIYDFLVKAQHATAPQRRSGETMAAAAVRHRTVEANGIAMHVAEAGPAGGDAPAVLFVHGFPELWYSWRHQMRHLAARGYRCVAPDLRGYGGTTAPPDPASYTIFHLVGDLVALLDALELPQVFVVGHDWGAIVSWNLCLMRPDRVRALVNLSVAFMPRRPAVKPLDYFRHAYGDDYYVCRFQEPGVENEFTSFDLKRFFKLALTVQTTGSSAMSLKKMRASNKEITLPPWLSEEDISYLASVYAKTGFAGGINYYRCLDLNWELMAPWTGAKVLVPTKFIVGDGDLSYNLPGVKSYIQGGLKKDVPMLEEVVVIKGAGHFIQQERAEEISDHIYNYIKKFNTGGPTPTLSKL
uniref:soluble epoxide hydrolase n=1 Tax=Leersia perrieri TaxID=77586 RepID=A0A0D9W0Z1_9ORYZ